MGVETYRLALEPAPPEPLKTRTALAPFEPSKLDPLDAPQANGPAPPLVKRLPLAPEALNVSELLALADPSKFAVSQARAPQSLKPGAEPPAPALKATGLQPAAAAPDPAAHK